LSPSAARNWITEYISSLVHDSAETAIL